MLSKDDILKDFFGRVAEARKNPPPELLAALRHAGAFLDIARLIRDGWSLKNGLNHGEEVLEDGSVILLRNHEEGGRTVTCAAGLAGACHRKGDDRSHPRLTGAALVDAYAGRGPYCAYLRWLEVPGDAPETLRAVTGEIEAATLEASESFLEDLERLYGDKEYSGRRELNPHDTELAKLYVQAEEYAGSDQPRVVRRIYAPMVRALLTDDDPEGRAFLAGTEDVELLLRMATHIARVRDVDGLRPLLGMILLKFWGRMASEFRQEDFLQTAALANFLDEYTLSTLFFAKGISLEKEDKKRSSIAFDSSLNLYSFLKGFPEDLAALDYMVAHADACAGDLATYDQFRVLRALAHGWRDEVAAKATQAGAGDGKGKAAGPSATDLLQEALERRVTEFDAGIDKDTDIFKVLPASVKAQLEWQTLLAILCGNLRGAIESFPVPFYADGSSKGFLPPRTNIGGQSLWDLWRGLFPDFRDVEFDDLLGSLVHGLHPCARGDGRKVPTEEQTGERLLVAHNLLRPPLRRIAEIAPLAVRLKSEDSKGAKTSVPIALPYLPKQNRRNEANAVFRVWEYFPWRDTLAADARIELENGRTLYATLPFYVLDRRAIVRGHPEKGRIAVFPSSVTKCKPRGARFYQGNSNRLFCRSFVEGRGIVSGIRETATGFADGRTLVLLLDIGGVGPAIPLYVHHGHVKGDPRPGDCVEFDGWVYADAYDSAMSFDEFHALHPDGLEVPEAPEEKDPDETRDAPERGDGRKGKRAAEGGRETGSGRDGGIAPPPRDARDAIFLLECRLAGTSHVEGIVGKMAKVTPGTRLDLRRERDNAWDSDAIAVYTPGNERVGYVPKDQNQILSRLLDGGKTLSARVRSKKAEAAYLDVTLGIYLED